MYLEVWCPVRVEIPKYNLFTTTLEEIPKYSVYQDVLDIDYTKKMHNYYCTNQQMNPHTPAVMKSLGLPETDVEIFCRDLLFPKL